MSVWNVIMTYLRLRLRGFESAADYILGLLNKFLERDDVAKNVEKGHAVAVSVREWMDRLRKYCPAPWAKYYEALYVCVVALCEVFADGKVDSAELRKVCDEFKAAYDKWREE